MCHRSVGESVCVWVQYMVVYQLMLSLCSNTAFFLDGSGFDYNQVRPVCFALQQASIRHADASKEEGLCSFPATTLRPSQATSRKHAVCSQH